MADDNEDPKDAPVNPGRRRLLGMIKYVPPIVIGAITLEQAGCQPSPSCVPQGGCAPSGCAPNNCAPVQGCPPTTGCPPGIAPPSSDPTSNGAPESDPVGS